MWSKFSETVYRSCFFLILVFVVIFRIADLRKSLFLTGMVLDRTRKIPCTSICWRMHIRAGRFSGGFQQFSRGQVFKFFVPLRNAWDFIRSPKTCKTKIIIFSTLKKCKFIVFKFFNNFMSYVLCWYFVQWFIGVATKEINFFEKKPILLVCKNVWLYIYKEKNKKVMQNFP